MAPDLSQGEGRLVIHGALLELAPRAQTGKDEGLGHRLLREGRRGRPVYGRHRMAGAVVGQKGHTRTGRRVY